MVTYTLSEVASLVNVMENIAGCGHDYPLIPYILEGIKNKGVACDIDTIVKEQMVQYLCMCNNCTNIRDYIAMGIDDILHKKPLGDMPLYLNCSGSEILKRIAATWRLMIGK